MSAHFSFQQLESFFWRRNAGQLLSFRDEEDLDDGIRRKIVNEIVDFMIQSFGMSLIKNQREMTARAAIILFRGLKYKPGGVGQETVSFYLPSKNSVFTTCLNNFPGITNVRKWMVQD